MEPVAIILAYLVFCLGNHKALIAGQEQLNQFYIFTKDLADKANIDISSLKPFAAHYIENFHLSVIVVFVIGIAFVSWLRIRSQNKTNIADTHSSKE